MYHMSTLKEKEALDKLTHLSQSCKQQRGIIRSYSESYHKHPDRLILERHVGTKWFGENSNKPTKSFPTKEHT